MIKSLKENIVNVTPLVVDMRRTASALNTFGSFINAS